VESGDDSIFAYTVAFINKLCTQTHLAIGRRHHVIGDKEVYFNPVKTITAKAGSNQS